MTINVTPPNGYDRKTIFLHWLSAALVIALWAAGQTIDAFPKGMPRITVRSLHITFGAVLAIVIVLRMMWRRNGGNKLPASNNGVLGKVAIGVHQLLYFLLIVVVTIGLACVWIRGDNLFNLLTVPAFDPGNKDLRHNAVELHGLLANILLSVAALHALAAIWHHLVKKDMVLRRMWPSFK